MKHKIAISNIDRQREFTKGKEYIILDSKNTALGLSIKIKDDNGITHWVMANKSFTIKEN